MEEFSRTQLLIGEEGLARLSSAHVAVFGIGGVGSFAVEALARAGVGTLTLVDNDVVCPSNINRQLIATHRTIGRKKVEVMKERILEINPACRIETYDCFYSSRNAAAFPMSSYTYVLDAIDSVSSKLTLIEQAKAAGVAIISCMGAGNKLDPTRFEVADIRNTSVCPLARVMRRELRARGIVSLKVVYSKEEVARHDASGSVGGQPGPDLYTLMNDVPSDAVACPSGYDVPPPSRRQIPGSISFVPSVAGLIMAGEAIKDILRNPAPDPSTSR